MRIWEQVRALVGDWNGYTVKFRDYEGLAERVMTILRDDGLRREFSRSILRKLRSGC